LWFAYLTGIIWFSLAGCHLLLRMFVLYIPILTPFIHGFPASQHLTKLEASVH
jgi:hypothetical protein